jgi:4-hydroxyphenylpyruvate dioxygenase
MQTSSDRPLGGKFLGFDHIHFWVGNALQAAGWYCTRFGFEYYAYRYFVVKYM